MSNLQTSVQNNMTISLGENLGSHNASYESLRITQPVQGREAYQALERREIPRGFIPRFHAKCNVVEGGCWLWQAGKYRRGYGMFSLGRFSNGRQHVEYAHRVAYVLAKGAIPAGKVVMHSCDTPACVNPDHLSLGTQGDNVRDAAQKGHYSVPKRRGCKLTPDQVAAICASHEKGVRLAERYGVSPAHISLLRNGHRRKAA